MFDPFEGMAELGFTRLPEADALFKPEPKSAKAVEQGGEEEKINPESYVYLKSRTCPVCGKVFQDAALRVTKCKFLRGDTDLRPHFEPIDPMYYEAVVCYYCGYSALHSSFDTVTDRQAGYIRTAITPQFKYREYPLIYTAKDAIERYKLALLCAFAKRAKDSEKAWLCLKLAWLNRETQDSKAELGFMQYAIEGFESAFTKESFPIYGMDDATLLYMLGELSRRVGKPEEAMRYIGRVLVSKNATDKLKDRARNVKQLLDAK